MNIIIGEKTATVAYTFSGKLTLGLGNHVQDESYRRYARYKLSRMVRFDPTCIHFNQSCLLLCSAAVEQTGTADEPP